jgi:hypothetical protein
VTVEGGSEVRDTSGVPPLEIAFTVACTPAHAFDVYARRTSLWWPSTHSVSGDPALEVVIEPRVGGRIYERTAAGQEHDWGWITSWDEPTRLGYRWYLGTDRTLATKVEITFAASGAGKTEVTIRHSGWEAHGEGADVWRDRNRGGWSGVLPRYQNECHSERNLSTSTTST